MKKKLIIPLIVLLLILAVAIPAFCTADPAQQAADELHELGLFQGVGLNADGTPNYDLQRTPTRQEAVTMLVRLLGAEDEAQSRSWDTPFADVDEWARPYVGYAYAHGLTQGVAAERFGGQQAVSASQYITFVLRALGYASGTDFAWERAWELSDRLGVTDGSYTAATGQFSRGDVAIISRNALSAPLKGQALTLGEQLGQSAAAVTLDVHFIDVGQADSILVACDGHFLLIDGGNDADGDDVVNYLRAQGVQRLDVVVGTHPHEDHIGGLDEVLNAFPAEMVIIPEKEHTTQTFADLLDAVEAQGLSLTAPRVGERYQLGQAALTVVAPNADYGDELNDWSVGLRITLGETAFLLCGDAESAAEEDMLSNGLSLTADVLKLSHHGSSTATTAAFLQRVAPRWAVISCGADNSYGHPHEETLHKLAAAGIQIFRTDRQGTVIASSNGSSIVWSAAPTPAAAPDAQPAGYVLNTNTMKFHYPTCRSVDGIAADNRQESSAARDELLRQGYSPCGACQP